jgi:hypothetical protein
MNFVTALVLGVINAAIVGVILLLVGAIVVWGLSFIAVAVPWNIQKLYIALVALICIGYVVAALLGVAVPGPFSRPFWH